MLKRVFLSIATTSLLCGCPAPTRPPSAPTPESVPQPSPAPAPSAQGTVFYDVNPQASSVRILVFRGGTLARFAHNHVMSVQGLRGRVWTHPSLAKSGFDFSFPVGEMIVDDPQARSAAGSDFPPDVSEKDRTGTRKNMLGADVLNAGQFPQISIRSVSISGDTYKPSVVARITIRGTSRDVSLAPAVSIENARFTATGEFDVLQSDFGIEPFTAALGALAVQDRLHVMFSVVAEKR